MIKKSVQTQNSLVDVHLKYAFWDLYKVRKYFKQFKLGMERFCSWKSEKTALIIHIRKFTYLNSVQLVNMVSLFVKSLSMKLSTHPVCRSPLLNIYSF